MHQRFPGQRIRTSRLGQEYFHLTRATLSPSQQPRRDDPRIVQHHAIAWSEVSREVAEHPVLPLAARTVYHHHPRSRPVFQWLLRDQLRREMVVELTQMHIL